MTAMRSGSLGHAGEPDEPAFSEADPVERRMIELFELPEERRAEALERLEREHPEDRTRIRARVELLRRVGIDVLPASSDVPAFPERLGDFRLLERLGGGGMGVVYLARQESLGREVALKLIRPEQMYFPGARARFRREVELVARLSHPGIVPIHVVGEQDGIPYFAMQRIEGISLSDALNEWKGRAADSLTGRDFHAGIARRLGRAESAALPELFAGTWVQCCFRLLRQVASALEHAHEQGILHRDVKPSNILVTPDGRALLFDFGLASSAGADRLTRTGSQVGSLPYMSPEQLRGEELDARSDVYALGVTLYELLTSRLPFDEPSAGTLREAILSAVPVSIRALNRGVARDVETVALTAMERDRARRYASAASFAGDLANVLELRPIRAHRPGSWLRARRWMQRHPTASVAAVLGVLTLVIGPTVAAIVARRSEGRLLEEMAAAEQARKRADEEARRAGLEARASEAMLEFVLSLFEATDPYRSGGRDPAASELLEEGSRRIREELALEPEIQTRLMTRLAQIQLHRGRPVQASALFEESLGIARRVLGEQSWETLDARHGLAKAKLAANSFQEGETLLRELLSSYLESGRENPADLAQFQDELASALLSQGKWDEAAALLRGIEADERISAALDAHARIAVQCNLGYATAGQGDHERAEAHFRAAIRMARETIPAPGLELAGALSGLTWLLQVDASRASEVVELAEEAVEIRSTLQGGRSVELAQELDRLAVYLGMLGRWDECLARHREALDLAREVLGEGSAHEASFLGRYGADLVAVGDAEAEGVLRHALELHRSLPECAGAGTSGAAFTLGKVLAHAGRLDEALPLFEEAIRHQRLVQGGEARLVDLLGWLGKIHLGRDAPALAEPCFLECHAIAVEHAGPDSIDAAQAAQALAECRRALLASESER